MIQFASPLKVSRLARVKKGPIRFFLCFFPILASACATAPEPEVIVDQWEERFNFTGWNDPGEPYPLEGYVFREWWLNGRKSSEHLAFIVWDVNRDRMPDMVDRYSTEGRAVTREFDFDFDGVKDWSKKLGPDAKVEP